MKHDSLFWVVFDTSQFQKYYRDVHDVLAAPKEWILRYDYDEKLLTPGAITFAEQSSAKKIPIVLVYTQMDVSYQRQSGKSVVPEGKYQQVFVATRLGTMVAIIKKANKYHFDFTVSAYPNHEAATSGTLDAILAPMVTAKETPWDKWVSVSNQFDLFEKLRTGDAHANWSQIVQRLGQPNMQFKDDAFWRLEGPYKNNHELKPQVEFIKSGGAISQARAYYAVGVNHRIRFNLFSQTAGPVAPSRPQYEVKTSSSDTDAIHAIGGGVHELRHYTFDTIEYETGSVVPFRDQWAELTIETHPESPWPAGAQLKLLHRVRRNRLQCVIGVLLGLLGASGLIVGSSKLWENDVLNGLWIVLSAAASLVSSRCLLTGKIQFK
jgi:hypothetical protein